jgi:Uma2 family endonuclease
MTTTRSLWGEVYEMPPGTTADDLVRMPEDGYKNELYEGMLVREMTSPGHADICQRLGGELYVYARTTNYPNRILQNALFDLSPAGASKHVILAPDLAILKGNAAPSWDVPQEVPLLAVEVVSDSQTLAELALKAQQYRISGVEDVWVVDHRTRTVQVWTAQGMTTLADTQTLNSPLLPGFSLDVRYLLDG